MNLSLLTNPWVLLGLVLTLVGLVTGAGFYGMHVGSQLCEAKHLAQDNADLKAANGKILALEEAARKSEQDHAVALAAVGTQAAKDLADANAQKDRDVAAARAGALKLRYAQPNPPASKLPDPPTPASGSDDKAGGELPPEVTGKLFALADDADQVAKQLASCQAVVEADRK